jgi:hypothetical protein
MKTGLVPSAGDTGSRKIRTRTTSTSSTAQPVTAMEPVMPVAPSVGVSNVPCGAVLASAVTVFNVTAMGPTAFAAPVNVIVMAPVCSETRPLTNTTLIFRFPVPVPDAGDTVSHG